jgi:hypothetical protein
MIKFTHLEKSTPRISREAHLAVSHFMPSRRRTPKYDDFRLESTLSRRIFWKIKPESSVIRSHLELHLAIQGLSAMAFARSLSFSSERLSEFHHLVPWLVLQDASHCQPYVNRRITLV